MNDMCKNDKWVSGSLRQLMLGTLLVVFSAFAMASGDYELKITYPAGESPKVFQKGWVFGAKLLTKRGKDLSHLVKWSGDAEFDPPVGKITRPEFHSTGKQRIKMSYTDKKGVMVEKEYEFQVVSSSGYANIGTIAVCAADAHGCPACPHNTHGPVTVGSKNVTVDGLPAARVGDHGIAGKCCGSNEFKILNGDSTVLIDGMPAAKAGSRTKHCGGVGKLMWNGYVYVNNRSAEELAREKKAIEEFKNRQIKRESDSLYAIGIELYKSKNYNKARRKFQDARKAYPKNCDAIFYRGLCWYKDAEKLIADGSSGPTNNIKGQVHWAILDLDSALACNPKYVEAHFWKGLIFQNYYKNFREAIKSYKKCLALNPDRVWVNNNLGYCYREMNSYEQAIEYFQREISLQPDCQRSHSGLAHCANGLKRWNLAYKHYTRFMELDNYKDQSMYRHRGWVSYQAGNYDQAIADLKIAKACKTEAKADRAISYEYFAYAFKAKNGFYDQEACDALRMASLWGRTNATTKWKISCQTVQPSTGTSGCSSWTIVKSTTRYDNGVLQKEYYGKKGEISSEYFHGSYHLYYQNGQMKEKGHYQCGKADGVWKKWESNGQHYYTGEWKDGQAVWEKWLQSDGTWKLDKY